MLWIDATTMMMILHVDMNAGVLALLHHEPKIVSDWITLLRYPLFATP